MKIVPLVLSALLAALSVLAPLDRGLCAQPEAKARKARAKAPAKAVAKAQETPRLSAGELQHPLAGADNATRWDFDPAPVGRPFGKAPGGTAPDGQDTASPLRLRLGRESVRDPLTQKELTPRADPQKAGESLKNMKLKDALDKAGGKAEVQVDILKF